MDSAQNRVYVDVLVKPRELGFPGSMRVLQAKGGSGGTSKKALDCEFPHGQTAGNGLHPNHQKTMLSSD
jgi:hypothetical protein